MLRIGRNLRDLDCPFKDEIEFSYENNFDIIYTTDNIIFRIFAKNKTSKNISEQERFYSQCISEKLRVYSDSTDNDSINLSKLVADESTPALLLYEWFKEAGMTRTQADDIVKSKDNTGAIADSYKEKYPNIKIYAFELEEPEYYELLCISFMSDIWQNTLAYIKEEEQQLSSLDTNDETQKRVKDILFYIHEHYAEDIRIDDLAHYAHICRSECFRCFKRYFNKSPMSYLTEYRLSYAVKALKDSEKSVTEIAIECGFSTASYFGKQFKKAYAITPLQFRQSLQAQDKNG